MNNDKKIAAYALILGSFLMTVTMVLHPAGGSFEHLIRITTINVTAHSIAILSMPISIFGFWGAHKSFEKYRNLSLLAFITVALGHIAGIFAAAINGLTLPIFINQFKEATPEQIESTKLILKYNFALNHACDYILITFICIAILIWSAIILKTKAYPTWIAYLGIGLILGFLMGLVADFSFVNLYGFRIFIFGMVAWIIALGVSMIRAT